MLGIKSDDKKQSKKTTTTANSSQSSLNQKLLSIGREVLMQRSRMDKHWRKLGEEEQAAVLLMTLSYGSVSA